MPGKGRKRQKRARKGTGTIYEYRPGLFRGMIDLGVDASGKRLRKTATGRSEREVQEKPEQFKLDARNGLVIRDQKVTVAQHIEDWLRSKKASIRSSTYASYAIQAKTHILPALGHYKLNSLDYRHVNAFYASLDDKELSRRTVAYVAKVLRMALNDAVRKRLILENPANLAAKRTPGKSEARWMTQDEITTLLTVAQGERLESLYSLLLQTGLRPGEALGLR